MTRAAIVAKTLSRSGREPSRRLLRAHSVRGTDAELDAVVLEVLVADGWIVEGPSYPKKHKRSKPRPGVYAGSQGTHRRSA